MLYLSHKGVHSDFVPAERHKGRYRNQRFVEPRTQDPANVHDAPMWVRNQRNSWHGVDFPYHSSLDIAEYYTRYAETLLAVDESVGDVTAWLQERGLLESTLVIYMGDNGFAFGEHGLIDKRTAYEESMRVPMMMQCPELFRGGTVVDQVVANIDIAPTILAAAGLEPPAHMAGRSMMPLLQGQSTAWRDTLLYEYYWERNFPQTPTLHALRGSRYKYIRYQGIWDVDELYDLQADPLETTNLIFSEAHQATVAEMNQQLFDLLGSTAGMSIPIYRDRGTPSRLRRPDGPPPAGFPPQLIREPAPVRPPP
jgi:N-acetylglucosamine-6-sulfatase